MSIYLACIATYSQASPIFTKYASLGLTLYSNEESKNLIRRYAFMDKHYG